MVGRRGPRPLSSERTQLGETRRRCNSASRLLSELAESNGACFEAAVACEWEARPGKRRVVFVDLDHFIPKQMPSDARVTQACRTLASIFATGWRWCGHRGHLHESQAEEAPGLPVVAGPDLRVDRDARAWMTDRLV